MEGAVPNDMEDQGETRLAATGRGVVGQNDRRLAADPAPLCGISAAGRRSCRGAGERHFDLPDAEVYSVLLPGRSEHQSVIVEPDWAQVHWEMARVVVAMKLLKGEYTDQCAHSGTPAMGFDKFGKQYQQHALVTRLASRVGHKAGQTVESDWSGPTMQLLDPATGEWRRVYLFVSFLPFSRFAFV